MSSQNTPLVSHSCLVYTAAGVSIEIHISLTLFTQVKCVARSQRAAEGRAWGILRLLLYSPAHDGEHIKCSPVRAELATTLICLRPAPPPHTGNATLMSAKPCSLRLMTLLGIDDLLEGELGLGRVAFCFWLCLVEVENHDGAVGEFCWELEVLWGCSLDELAAGAAVAYC